MTKFKFGDSVMVTKGFYRGLRGTVKEYYLHYAYIDWFFRKRSEGNYAVIIPDVGKAVLAEDELRLVNEATN